MHTLVYGEYLQALTSLRPSEQFPLADQCSQLSPQSFLAQAKSMGAPPPCLVPHGLHPEIDKFDPQILQAVQHASRN